MMAHRSHRSHLGTHYVPGDYNVICDRCGAKVKASQTAKEWNGLRVCRRHWEPRHPQDFVRGRADRQAVPDARPEGTDMFLTAAVSASDLGAVSRGAEATAGGNTFWDLGETRWDIGVGIGVTVWD